MPKPISIVPYAKKSILVCEPEDENRLEWLHKTLSKLGATRTKSIDRPGWILSKENEEKFKDELLAFERGSKQHSTRRQSPEPESKKIKHSRKKPSNTDNLSSKNKYLESKNETELRDEEYKTSTKKTEKDSKPKSYIEWEDTREYDSHHDDVESDQEGSESDGNSTSDDELIQAVLARKMKYESSQKEIDEEEIKDSDEEDSVSYSRRMRHVYKVLAEYRKRITELEQIIRANKESNTPLETIKNPSSTPI